MKAKVRMISFITWITTIVLFIVGLFSFQFFKDSNHWYQVLATVWLGDIGVGILAFLVMLVASTNSGDALAHTPKNVEKAIRRPSGSRILIITLLILLALLGSGVVVSDYMETKKELNNLKEAQMHLTPIPSSPTIMPSSPAQRAYTNTQSTGSNDGSIIDCVGPDGKHMSVTQVECDKFNNAWKNPQDQIVSCRMQTSCGGQVLQITKKECDTIVCCEVDGKWSTYPDNATCDRAQNAANPVPTYKTTNWSAYYTCTSSASTRLSSAMSSCYPYISQGNSVSYELCKNTANNNYNADVQRCDSYK